MDALTEYQDFIAKKKPVFGNHGFAVNPAQVNELLKPFQRDIVAWAVRKGRAAVFADTGLGKTYVSLEWARLIGRKTIIVAPLSVARQTTRMAGALGLEVRYVRTPEQVTGDHLLWITNYEMIEKFDASQFDAVVLDECFPPDTPIDVFNIDKSLTSMYIKDIREGDAIYNASGEDHVKAIYKRQIKRAVRIEANGRKITCSENHPFFTLHGWRSAQDLRAGDYIMETGTAVRLVRENICTEISAEDATLLQSILLSEMAHEHTGAQSESAYAGSASESWSGNFEMAEKQRPESHHGDGTHNKFESDEPSRSASEGFIEIASDEAQTFRAWGQWEWFDGPATDFVGCTWKQLDSGIFFVTGPTDCGLSNRLQARLGESRIENQYRSGRPITLQPENGRCEAGCKSGFARVDSVEILEQGHPELEKYRDADGHVYFYDIKAARHPSFSVNGLLVHNSSILKAIDGKTRRTLTEMFSRTPYRLCCTATPAPNDLVEIGNHAEFLGISTAAEMKAMFFINANIDHYVEFAGVRVRRKGSNAGGQEWRLRHHGEEPFYKWMASWAMSVRRPSDLGYSDEGYILPPLTVTPEWLDYTYTPDDRLAFTGFTGIKDFLAFLRKTVELRCNAAAERVNADSDQWIVWTYLEDESALAHSLIPDSVEVKGSDSPERKAEMIEAFQDGKFRVLVTKPDIAGFGMNFQNASKQYWVTVRYSWEEWYQAIRRSYRFLQDRPVQIFASLTPQMQEVWDTIQAKERVAAHMSEQLISHVRKFEMEELGDVAPEKRTYTPNCTMKIPAWLTTAHMEVTA
jgi:hypothetical protein